MVSLGVTKIKTISHQLYTDKYVIPLILPNSVKFEWANEYFYMDEQNTAQLNFSGPWKNINTLCQYLLLQIYKTLPNLTLPDHFSIPVPYPSKGTHPSPAWGHLTPASNPDNLKFK